MKKLVLLSLLVALLSGSTVLLAQPGVDCSTPYVIPSAPFLQTGMTTAGFLDDYDNTMACGSAFMTGEDFVFAYTPLTDEIINIQLSNTGQYVGLFVIDSCPNVAGAICVAQSESILGNNALSDINLLAGHTYYIIVDTQDPILGFIPNPSTAFDIQITVTNPFDVMCNFIQHPTTSACDMAMDSIVLSLTNNGLVDVDSFDVAYSINGAPAVTETFFAVLPVGNTASYTFTALADFSTDNTTYTVRGWSSLAGDGVPANDTAAVTITNLMSVAAFPYNESFETGAGGWNAGGTNSSWALGTPASAIINSASDGSYAWVTNLTGNYNTAEASWLLSPCFDFSSLTVPMVQFDMWYNNSGLLDYTTLQYSTDQGITWVTIGQMNDGANWYNTTDGWSGSTGGWVTASHKLNGLGGLSGVQLRLSFAGSMIQTAEGFAFDHLSITEAPAQDMGVTAITAPSTFCGLGNEQVSVLVHNFGTASQVSVPVSFRVNGGSWINESVVMTLPADTTVAYTFTTPYDFSGMGLYSIEATTGLLGDMVVANDTASMDITNQTYVATYPYLEDFESGNGGWVSGGLNSSFALGTPVATVINHAASGNNAWVTNLAGSANMFEGSWVVSPCLDFTTLSLPIIEMQLWYETSGLMDSVKVEYSIDSGASWVNIGMVNDWMNWYNVAEGWSGQSGNYLTVKHSLDSLGGRDNVKIRIRYAGGNMPVEGVAFDDIRIYDSPNDDLGITVIESPVTGCGLSSEIVGVKIRNFGIDMQTGFPVKYSIDGGSTWVTENCTFSVYHNEEWYFAFTTPASLAAQGSYDIVVTTALVGDEDQSNDTARVTVYNTSIAVYPYTENFESDNGYYTTSGVSSWAWGVPSAPVIAYAASGTHAWVTNLSGNHMADESSSLYSACMDFSGLNNPFVEFNIWYETTFMGSVSLEGSVDGGATWTTVGSSTDTNWYNGLFVTGFSGNANGWLLMRHPLDNMAGQSNCKLRFLFNGGNSFLGVAEGVGIDDLKVWDCILPTASFNGNLNGSSFSGTNTSTNGSSYLWEFGDGNTATTVNTAHTYAAAGAYTVTLHVYNECGEDITTQNINISGIADAAQALQFECYPNPSQGQFVLSLNQTDLRDLTIQIMDITGRVLISESVPAAKDYKGTFDLGSNAKGLYYIQISAAGVLYTGKVVVE